MEEGRSLSLRLVIILYNRMSYRTVRAIQGSTTLENKQTKKHNQISNKPNNKKSTMLIKHIAISYLLYLFIFVQG